MKRVTLVGGDFDSAGVGVDHVALRIHVGHSRHANNRLGSTIGRGECKLSLVSVEVVHRSGVTRRYSHYPKTDLHWMRTESILDI